MVDANINKLLWTIMRRPSSEEVALVGVLKKCGRQGDLEKGDKIHADVYKSGILQNNIYISSALVSLYAKCGKLQKAQEVFDCLLVRNVVSWNALISGFAQHGYGQEAWVCFDRMQEEGLSPDSVTFLCIFKACSKVKDLCKGERIHAKIVVGGRYLAENNAICNALVDMYSKCRNLRKAEEVFHCIQVRDVVSWNARIAGYVVHGQASKALHCYEEMQCEGMSMDEFTIVSILKSCGSLEASERGEEIYAKIIREGFSPEENILLGNALLDMYAKCGFLAKAKEVFVELRTPNLVSWNCLVTGYTQHGKEKEAIEYCFHQMQQENFVPDKITCICILKACGSIRALGQGKEIHIKVVEEGLLNEGVFVGNALVDMYVKCGMHSRAQEVFDHLPNRDVSSWNVLIAGHSELGQDKEVLDCFTLMQYDGFSPNSITFIYVLKACGNFKSINLGKEIHAQVLREGSHEDDILIDTALLDMYAKCGELMKAQEIFDQLPIRNIVSWNALISGYAMNGYTKEALDCFRRMKCGGLSPNEATFICLLKACGALADHAKGEELHAEIMKERFPDESGRLGNALVEMYAKCGLLTKSQELFEELGFRDIVLWDVRIACFVQHEQGEEALRSFKDMQCQGILPDAIIFSHILRALACSGASQKGKEIHAVLIANETMLGYNQGILRYDQVLLGHSKMLRVALMDMYAKCGKVTNAQDIFNQLEARSIISWTTLMAGYAQLGHDEVVFGMVNEMITTEGIEPDPITFTIVLNVCSQSGLLDEAMYYFVIMTLDYGIIPTLEHYTCMVDLYGRAGQFVMAMAVIKVMPTCNCLLVWTTLLGACKKWGNVNLGRWAFEHSIELNEKNVTAYVCMSNIYVLFASMQVDETDSIKTS